MQETSTVMIPAILTNQPPEYFVIIASMIMPLVYRSWDLGTIYMNIEKYVSNAREALSLINDEDVIVENPTKTLSGQTFDIEFKNVEFKYPKVDEVVFEQFDLKISKGTKVGLVGPSGGGKSTIMKLILRFLDVSKGQILVNEIDVKDIALSDLYSKIAYVPQDPVLFHKSVYENIVHPNPDISDARLEEVLVKSHVKEFVDTLPKGLDTLVGERGVKLSGGQKQRIAIAKAMVKDAPILLLDEATSALDSESEKLIQESFLNLMQNRTVLVIAHRLSTISSLDEIVVLKDGKIVEKGNHSQLVALGGLYKTLWDHQSSGFIGED